MLFYSSPHDDDVKVTMWIKVDGNVKEIFAYTDIRTRQIVKLNCCCASILFVPFVDSFFIVDMSSFNCIEPNHEYRAMYFEDAIINALVLASDFNKDTLVQQSGDYWTTTIQPNVKER